MKRTNIFLIVIFLVGFLLRFYNLGEVPKGFHRDEAFLGYNAYSILKTGKDINGNFLPLHLESVIHSPAGYSYFTIPSVYIFGLNPFSVRFPAAFFGSLTIILTFLLIKQLFRKNDLLSYNLALLASALLAISPWHISLSRVVIENTIVVFFLVLGTYIFLKWSQTQKTHFLFLSFLSFAVGLFVYQAARAFLPLFIPVLILFFVRNNKMKIYSFLLFIFIIILPLFIVLNLPNLTSRINSLSVFGHPETQLILDKEIREDGVSNISSFISRIFHNKAVGYSSLVLENYFKHFSYSFLFTDNNYPERFRTARMGLLYIFELPLIVLGIYYLFKVKRRELLFILAWILLAPLGSSLTFDDVPNFQRTLIIFPALSLLPAAGLVFLLQLKLKYKKVLLGILLITVTYSILFYVHQYYVHNQKNSPWLMNDGYKELVKNVNNYLLNYNSAIITNRETAPTIFFLFYGKYNPENFQKETKGAFGAKSDSVNFSKYKFTDKECPLRTLSLGEKTDEKLYDGLNTGERGILYINHGNCEPPKISVIELSTIKRGDGSVVFRVFEVK